MLLPGRTFLLVSALACAACGTQTPRRPLLSAARLAIVEGQTAKVYADVANFGDLTIKPPPEVTIMKVLDASGVGFSVKPSCYAAPGHDITANVEVQASDGRSETLVLAITNNATADCFVDAELEMSPPFACADLDGSGALTVVSPGQMAVVEPTFQTSFPTTVSSPGGAPDQLFALPTASQGLAIYGVTGGELWVLDPAKPAWVDKMFKVGVDVVPLRSSTSSTAPDYLVGNAGSNWVQFTRLDNGKNVAVQLPDVDIGTAGGTFGLGTWSSDHGIAVVVDNVDSIFGPGNPSRVLAYDVHWNTDGSFAGVTLHAPATANDFSPTYRPDPNAPPIVITVADRQGSPDHDDLVANIVTGPFDNAVGEIAIPVMNQPLTELSKYGAVRSIAPAPDGSVLLGSDSGALRTRYVGNEIVYEPIDLIAQGQPDLPIGYGANIAPCLAADGSLAGYVVATGQYTIDTARVALLPGAR